MFVDYIHTRQHVGGLRINHWSVFRANSFVAELSRSGNELLRDRVHCIWKGMSATVFSRIYICHCPQLRTEMNPRSRSIFLKFLLENYLMNSQDTLDRESIASQCMDIHRNPRISKWISTKAWIIED